MQINTSDQVYSFHYACVLVPHSPSHQLKNGIAESLPLWIEEICARYEWKKEFIIIDPAYLQWGIQVDSRVQINQFVKTIRSETSSLILQGNQNLRGKIENDFWAPGYLVVFGAYPRSKEMVEQYIRLARRCREE